MEDMETLKGVMTSALQSGIENNISNYNSLVTKGFTVFISNEENVIPKFCELMASVGMDTVLLTDNVVLVKTQDKVFTPAELDVILNDNKDVICESLEFRFSKLDEAKIKQITKEELQKIWTEKDLESKRKLVLDLIDSLEYKSTSLGKILEKVKETQNPNELDKIVTNLMFVGYGEKVIKI